MHKRYIVRLNKTETRATASGDQKTQRHEPESAPRANSAQSRCRRSGVDRSTHCRGVRLSPANGGERSPTVCRARLRTGIGGEKTPEAADTEAAGGQTRSATDRDPPGSATERLWQLESAAVSSPSRGAGDRRSDQSRNGASDVKKNGMTQRMIDYWVIPPQCDGEFVAHNGRGAGRV